MDAPFERDAFSHPVASSRDILKDIVEGLKALWDTSFSRTMTIVILAPSLLAAMWQVVYVLDMMRYLRLGVLVYGALTMCGAMGGLFGALMRTPLAHR
ncbi:MAG: hypothetical protein OWU33_05165 [Firmicutes bacterium]|nr:hypothetical protein [Bacillota bacterium]